MRVWERRTWIKGDRVIKRLPTKAMALREAYWYHRVPWACPELLAFDPPYLVTRRYPVALHTPEWRDPQGLRALIRRLNAEGIHHRDVHLNNVVKGPDGPLLIDWEYGIRFPGAVSYDLYGKHRTTVPPPVGQYPRYNQWWGKPGAWGIHKNWERDTPMYQPLFKYGEEHGEGVRDASARYEIIARHFPSEPFSMLDIGANRGYFCFRAAHEFDARCVAVDPIDVLPCALDEVRDGRVVGIHEAFTAEDVKGKGPFGVGLLLSVLHHMEDWEGMLTAMMDECSVVFVECALEEEGAAIPDAARAGQVTKLVSSLGEEIGRPAGGIGRSSIMRPIYKIG